MLYSFASGNMFILFVSMRMNPEYITFVVYSLRHTNKHQMWTRRNEPNFQIQYDDTANQFSN